MIQNRIRGIAIMPVIMYHKVHSRYEKQYVSNCCQNTEGHHQDPVQY